MTSSWPGFGWAGSFVVTQAGDVAFEVPMSLVVTLERVLGNESVGEIATCSTLTLSVWLNWGCSTLTLSVWLNWGLQRPRNGGILILRCTFGYNNWFSISVNDTCAFRQLYANGRLTLLQTPKTMFPSFQSHSGLDSWADILNTGLLYLYTFRVF
jgi:hypothetical protein